LANQWARRASAGFIRDSDGVESELWFLTLTLGNGVRSALKGFSLLPGLWDTTRKAYQRYYSGFSYVAFVEGQPHRGHMPHFHILTTEQPPTRRGRKGYVTQHGVHSWAHSLGWGFEAKLLIVSSAEASAYVAKYASKQSPLTPKGFRRVRCSNSWPKVEEKSGPQWIVPAKNEDVAAFINRVNEITNIPAEQLWPAWAEISNILAEKQNYQ